MGAADKDIGNYSDQLQSYISANPYKQGGEYSQTINPGLTATSDANSNALKGALQSQSLRTGMNSAADAATAASASQQNTRDLSTALASSNQNRINSEAGYNANALSASALPAQMQSSLYGTSLSGGNSALNTAQSAAQTPSIWDELGGSLVGGASSFLGGYGGALGKRIGGG